VTGELTGNNRSSNNELEKLNDNCLKLFHTMKPNRVTVIIDPTQCSMLQGKIGGHKINLVICNSLSSASSRSSSTGFTVSGLVRNKGPLLLIIDACDKFLKVFSLFQELILSKKLG